MKVMVTLKADSVSPRFDLATEVLIAECAKDGPGQDPRNVLMPGPSADELCNLALRERVDVIICGGIEESFYQYLQWKKIRVIDRIIGRADAALELVMKDELSPGMVIGNSAGRQS